MNTFNSKLTLNSYSIIQSHTINNFFMDQPSKFPTSSTRERCCKKNLQLLQLWAKAAKSQSYLGCVRESGESRAPFSRNSWMSLSYNNKHNFPSIPLCVSSFSNFSRLSMASALPQYPFTRPPTKVATNRPFESEQQKKPWMTKV